MIMRLIIKKKFISFYTRWQMHYFCGKMATLDAQELLRISYHIGSIKGPPCFDVSALISIDVN